MPSPTIVLVHGAFGDASSWRPVYDRPGHDPVPHRRPPGVLGRGVRVRPPVRPPHPGGKKGQGNGYLRGALGQAATGTAGIATFLGERYTRMARRRGKAKAQVAVARSILVIISPGTCWPTPLPGSPTSATATTRPAPIPTASSVTTSGRSKPSASTSP